MKFVGSRVGDPLVALPLSEYSVAITEQGKRNPQPCFNLSGDNNNLGHVEIYEKSDLQCRAPGGFQYRINIKTMRYTAFYTIGYINGNDDVGDEPSVTAGTCTKIE